MQVITVATEKGRKRTMAKEIRVLCDHCGKDVYGKEYYTFSPSRVRAGDKLKLPTLWLCRECTIKTNIFISEVKE